MYSLRDSFVDLELFALSPAEPLLAVASSTLGFMGLSSVLNVHLLLSGPASPTYKPKPHMNFRRIKCKQLKLVHVGITPNIAPEGDGGGGG
jgi:hypothetical protein